MSFRRRLMMAQRQGGGGSLPVANGMLYWLDGKDITAGMTDWQCSTRIQCIAPDLKIRFSTSGNTLRTGECLEITGSNGGATAQIGDSSRISNNPFYTASMAASDSVTMEAVFNILMDREANIIGGISQVSGVKAYYRYRFSINTSGDLILNYVRSNNSWYRPVLYQGIQSNTNYYITFQREGTILRLYINAVKVYEEEDTSYNIPIVANTGLICFGRATRLGSTSDPSSGKYYSQSMYNRALSESEILSNYNTFFSRYNLS